MIVQITDKNLGDKLLSEIPIQKYPHSDPIWALKAGYFADRYKLAAQYNDRESKWDGMMLYYMIGDTCYIVIIYAPNMLLTGYADLWNKFEEFLGGSVNSFRWWTAYPKQFARMTGAKELFTMMEKRKGA